MISVPQNYAPHSKLWLFIIGHELNSKQLQWVHEQLLQFTSSWKAHNIPLQATFEITNRLVWLSVNANTENASGCSIDGLYRKIAEIEKETNIVFTDKMWLLSKDGQCLHAVHHATQLHKLQNQQVLDLSISTIAQIPQAFIPSGNCWAKSKIYS